MPSNKNEVFVGNKNEVFVGYKNEVFVSNKNEVFVLGSFGGFFQSPDYISNLGCCNREKSSSGGGRSFGVCN